MAGRPTFAGTTYQEFTPSGEACGIGLPLFSEMNDLIDECVNFRE